MNEKELKVLDSLIEKLSALRRTISNEERAILDALVTEEVGLHRMVSKMTERVHIESDPAVVDEVTLHKMTTDSASKMTSAMVDKLTMRITLDGGSYKVVDKVVD